MSQERTGTGEYYKCEHCGGIFEEEWTEAERLAEFRRYFPDEDPANGVRICDDCYQRISKWLAARPNG